MSALYSHELIARRKSGIGKGFLEVSLGELWGGSRKQKRSLVLGTCFCFPFTCQEAQGLKAVFNLSPAANSIFQIEYFI